MLPASHSPHTWLWGTSLATCYLASSYELLRYDYRLVQMHLHLHLHLYWNFHSRLHRHVVRKSKTQGQLELETRSVVTQCLAWTAPVLSHL